MVAVDYAELALGGASAEHGAEHGAEHAMEAWPIEHGAEHTPQQHRRIR